MPDAGAALRASEAESRPRLLAYVDHDLLGDALIKLPAVRALRAAFPRHHITWLAGRGPSAFRSLLRPLVEGLLDAVIDQAEPVRSLLPRLAALPARPRFDVVLDTQSGLLTALRLRQLPHRVFVSPAARFLLSDRRPGDAAPAGQSLTERLVELVCLAGGTRVTAEHIIALPPDCRAAAAHELPPGPRYIGIAPGAGDRSKCWPLERFIALAGELRRRGCTPVLLLGPNEVEWVARLRRELPDALIPDLTTPDGAGTPVQKTLALAERLTLAVANDSGAGHLLASAGCLVVTLYGRTDPRKWTASGQKRIAVRAAEVGSAAIGDIPAPAVLAAVEQALAPGARDA